MTSASISSDEETEGEEPSLIIFSFGNGDTDLVEADVIEEDEVPESFLATGGGGAFAFCLGT